jgi:dUTP pyrophosphatase
MARIVKYKKISADAYEPVRATSGSAAFDICSCEDLEVPVGRTVLVGTGLSLEIPPGFEGQVRPRSGLSKKHSITIPNSPGTIDSDYRGEVKVLLSNGGYRPFSIEKGMRIAQLVIAEVPEFVFVESADDLTYTDRGDGGFGSTGVSSFEIENRRAVCPDCRVSFVTSYPPLETPVIPVVCSTCGKIMNSSDLVSAVKEFDRKYRAGD